MLPWMSDSTAIFIINLDSGAGRHPKAASRMRWSPGSLRAALQLSAAGFQIF
jgi:hypothetical protein